MDDMLTRYAIEQSGLAEMIRLRRVAEREPTAANISAARRAEQYFDESEWSDLAQVFPRTRARYLVYGGQPPPMTSRETAAYISLQDAIDARRHISQMNDWLASTQEYSHEFREQNPTYRHVKKRAKITERRAIDAYNKAGNPRRLGELHVPYESARFALQEYGGSYGPHYWREQNEVSSDSE